MKLQVVFAIVLMASMVQVFGGEIEQAKGGSQESEDDFCLLLLDDCDPGKERCPVLFWGNGVSQF